MNRRVPRSDSAPVRSGISSKPSSQVCWCSRAVRRVRARGTPDPGAASVAKTAPGANRASGSSVWVCTVTSPRRPCGLPMRATSSLVSAGMA